MKLNNLVSIRQKRFQNSHNSCRYDSFLSFYLYSIYNSDDPSFGCESIFPPPELLSLYICCDNITEGGDLHEERDKLWAVLYINEIDSRLVGKIGFVTDLFKCFREVSDFKLI